MRLGEHVIGVCSWSLKCPSVSDLARALRELSLCHTQLAIGPLLEGGIPAIDEAMKTLEKEHISLTAGMIGFPGEDYTSIATIRATGGFVPTGRWGERRSILEKAAKAGHRLNLEMISTHVGFVPASSEAGYEVMVQRVQDVAEIFGEYALTLLLETGQEGPNELLQFLNDVAKPNVGVNFDPANMILYGAGRPVDAVRVLARHVKHVHIKDAIASSQPGVLWGEEVPFGKGQVDALAFLETLRFGGYDGPLVIEREAGQHRMGDVRHAVGVISSVLQPKPTADSE